MKAITKIFCLAALVFTLSSCEINDELLERSDSTIYNKLEADRNSSGQSGTHSQSKSTSDDMDNDSHAQTNLSEK